MKKDCDISKQTICNTDRMICIDLIHDNYTKASNLYH